MEPSNLPQPPVRAAAAGELVVLNGRQSGTRRALGVPTTFLGRAPECDLRLNVEGVEPFHCVLTYHAGEASIRDLNTSRGTFVNGQRISGTPLRDGDLLDVGPFRFRVLLPAPRPTAAVVVPLDAERESVRIQAAAIAAHQAALDEQEAQLAAAAEEHAQRSAALDQARSELQQRERTLALQQVQFNTERELDSRLLQDGLRSLSKDHQRWRRRRDRENMALRARRLLLVDGERRLAQTRAAILREKQTWDVQQHALQFELHGLNNRIIHQRQQLQELEVARRAAAVRPTEAPGAPPSDAALARRAAQLDQVASELANQRAQLVEQWERLARLQHDWEARRDAAAGELETLGQRLARQAETLAARAQEIEAAEARLRERQEQLDQVRREAALELARAQAQQQTWQTEGEQMLIETTRRSDEARRQLDALTVLRRKWNRRRQQETAALRAERLACQHLHEELMQARYQLEEPTRLLEAARRAFADEVRAIESGRPLAHRWLAQSAALVRALTQQRKAFASELAALATREQELTAQREALARAVSDTLQRQTDVEYREAELAAAELRLQQATRHSEQRRWSMEHKLIALQEEAEQLARALIADVDAPPAALERAA
jgi:hypothetical protein